MATKPSAPRVISGTYSSVYIDGDLIAEATAFSATLKVSRESMTFANNLMEDSKLTGLSGEFTVKIKKIYSRAQTLIAEKIKDGTDVRVTIIGVLNDPDAYGSERVVLENCYFNDTTLMDFEVGKVGEEEISGGFTSFYFPDTIAVQ